MVPTVCTLDNGLKICMYVNDHAPAHFHAIRGKSVRGGDQVARVRIDNLEAMDSTLSRADLERATAWARGVQRELQDNWDRLRAGQTPLPISS